MPETSIVEIKTRRLRLTHRWIWNLIFGCAGVAFTAGFCQIQAQMASQAAVSVPAKFDWKTGAAFDQAIKSPTSVSWTSVPLRASINQFARQQRTAIVIDRRIDPGQLISLNRNNLAKENFVRLVAEEAQAQFCQLNNCFYIGPPQAARNLFAAHQQLNKNNRSKSRGRSPSSRTRKWATRQPLAWDDLATPRSQLQKLADENELEIKGLDSIPHDLMAAASLPPMRLDMRFAVLLVQFDKWFKISARSNTLTIVDLKPISRTSLKLSSYPITAEEIRSAPGINRQLKVTKKGQTLTVSGPVEQVMLARNLAMESLVPQAAPIGNRRFTLTIESQRLAILQAIAQQLSFQLELPAASSELNAIATVAVKDVTLDELVAAILEGTQLKFDITDNAIQIRAADP